MRWSCLAAMAAVVLGGMILAPRVHAEGLPWAYTHPGSKVLIGVDWQRAKSSSTGQMLRRQLTELSGARMDISKGFDFIETVDHILISTPGELTGAAEASQVLIALSGKVDAAMLRKTMIPGTAVERYRGIDLLIPPRGAEGQDMIAALVNESLTLIGDRASIEAALGEGQGMIDLELRNRAAQLAGTCEIWMIAATPPVRPEAAASAAPFVSGLDQLLAMDLGVSLANGLGLRMNLEFEDAASAQSLAMGTQMLTSMFGSGNGAPPEIAQIARGLQIEQTGSRLRMNLDIPLDVLEKGVLQARSGIEEAGPRTLEGLLGMRPGSGALAGVRPSVKGAAEPLTATAAAPPRRPAAPAQPVTRKIRIVGLEEGEREIEYTVGGRRP